MHAANPKTHPTENLQETSPQPQTQPLSFPTLSSAKLPTYPNPEAYPDHAAAIQRVEPTLLRVALQYHLISKPNSFSRICAKSTVPRAGHKFQPKLIFICVFKIEPASGCAPNSDQPVFYRSTKIPPCFALGICLLNNSISSRPLGWSLDLFSYP